MGERHKVSLASELAGFIQLNADAVDLFLAWIVGIPLAEGGVGGGPASVAQQRIAQSFPVGLRWIRCWGSRKVQTLRKVCRHVTEEGGLVVRAEVERCWSLGLSEEVHGGPGGVVAVNPVGPAVGVSDFAAPDLIDQAGWAATVEAGQSQNRAVLDAIGEEMLGFEQHPGWPVARLGGGVLGE